MLTALVSSQLAAALLVAAQLPTGSASPVGSLTAGWVYLPGEGIDSWPGIFHDAASGACVLIDAAWPFVVKPVSSDGAIVGESHGVRYHRRERDSRCRGGKYIEASFFPKDKSGNSLVWNFGADVCDETQRQRVEALLFRDAVVGAGNARPEQKTRVVPSKELDAIKPGTSWADVASRLGVPSDSSCERDGGFNAGYAVEHKDSYRELDLRFDRRQQLVSAKRRHPGY